MAMTAAGGGNGEPMTEINTTPLVDVLLVLLIMFIMTLPVLTHSVKLDLAGSGHGLPVAVRPEPINLEIDFDGTIIWNGYPVPAWALETYFRREALKDPQAELHIRPHMRAPYDDVIQVLAVAQRNGMRRVGFVNSPELLY